MHQQPVKSAFVVRQRNIPCQHKMQIYVDYGSTTRGPWIVVGINAVEYSVGYLPPKQKAKLNLAAIAS